MQKANPMNEGRDRLQGALKAIDSNTTIMGAFKEETDTIIHAQG
jgi:hypothetical protein